MFEIGLGQVLTLIAVPLGVMWWLDTLIKRSQRKQRQYQDGPRGFEVKMTGAGPTPVPPMKKLKPPGPALGASDTPKGDHG